MKPLKMLIVATAFSVLGAGAAIAQTPPAGQPAPVKPSPPPQTPPAGQPPAAPAKPPAAQTPPAPQAPLPFPEGAKIAYVNIQAIASLSVEGKAATGKLEEFKKKKTAEISEKTKGVTAMQTKLQQGGSVMSEQARAQLEKEIEKAQRDLQFVQQDANTEMQDLTQQLQAEFQQKLNPVIEQIATEKGLHMVLSITDSGAIWANRGLDLSDEVIKRFDAIKTAPAKK